MSKQRVARVYQRVSTDQQDLERQDALVEQAQQAGYYVAAVYREKASGTTTDRPELQRMIADLQPEDVVIAEKIDRISRLPLDQAEALIQQIKAKGARLSVPDLIDLSQVSDAATGGMAKIVMDALQDMLLKLALQSARDDYETRRVRQRQGIEKAKQEGVYRGRKADSNRNARIIKLRANGSSIAETAKIIGCSVSQVKLVCSKHRKGDEDQHQIDFKK